MSSELDASRSSKPERKKSKADQTRDAYALLTDKIDLELHKVITASSVKGPRRIAMLSR
jgi:hypothetical protein